jgi:outer membrane protein
MGRIIHSFKWTAVVLLVAGQAGAQNTSFPKPSYFRETFAPINTRVDLKGPVNLGDFVVGDRLSLSLKSYLQLVMSNNTDIQLQFLTLESPKNAIMRAMATWDPLATASFTSTRSTSASVTALSGANTTVSLNQPANFGFIETLPTGMQFNVGYSASKFTTNSSFATLNPSLTSQVSFSFSQPLLRNRGVAVNRLNLILARSRLHIADSTLRNSLLQLVNSAENAYWDVVQARENLRVAVSAKKLADDSLTLSQRELDLGAISPLDIYNPQQQVANADLGVSQARFALIQVENALRKQIGADLDPKIRKLPIELTEGVEAATAMGEIDAEHEVEKAIRIRPDLRANAQTVDADDLTIRQAKNEILPSLSFTGSYSSQGVGGNVFQSSTDTLTGVVSSAPPIPGGYADALSQMFGFGYPTYSFGLNLSLPIRNRAATADMADALVQKKRDVLTVRNTQQQIRLSVLEAVSNVEASKESLKLARVARDFAAKYLDAENQKFTLGSEPMQFVLQAQTQLSQAESAVVQAQVGLRRNLLNLLSQTGELLDDRGIVVQ